MESNIRTTRSFVFRTAWRVAGAFDSFADALRYAWRVAKLKLRMLAGAVEFAYRKVDGTVRTAVGTLAPKYVDYEYKGQASSCRTLAYYDIERGGFRCCRLENIIFQCTTDTQQQKQRKRG